MVYNDDSGLTITEHQGLMVYNDAKLVTEHQRLMVYNDDSGLSRSIRDSWSTMVTQDCHGASGTHGLQ